jgi:tetratricopeptide (TPR) repeat protein
MSGPSSIDASRTKRLERRRSPCKNRCARSLPKLRQTPMARPVNVERLQSNIAWAVAHGLGARDLIPMLERLIAHALVGSDCRVAAERQLAELVVEHAPWRAALLTRNVLKHKDDDRAWALLGLAHTLLGNHRSARRAYMHALARAPGCASYAHNLGHLIDVAFDQPREALRWLKQAHGAAPDEEEIAASYAHALARTEQVPQALMVLEKVLNSRARAQKLVDRWLARGRFPLGAAPGQPLTSAEQPAAAKLPAASARPVKP